MSEISIKGITMDSRRVNPGDLFIAVQGLTVDGRQYIEQAIQKGAVAVLAEYPMQSLQTPSFQNVPIIQIPHLRDLIGFIASRFFAHPSKKIPVIGVTGTNGKTSTTHFIAQILTNCEKPCAIMGTLGVGFLESLKQNMNPREMHCTTQDAIATQETLAYFREQDVQVVAMEVTSHALTQGRLNGIEFDTTIFTNLTRDHLEYHETMQEYWAAKRSLFTRYPSKTHIINWDDDHGKALIEQLPLSISAQDTQVIAYTTQQSNKIHTISKRVCVVSVENIELNHHGIHAWLKTPWGEGQLNCPLLGQFNLSNILAAIAAVCVQGIPFPVILETLPSLNTVPGRMMRFGGGKEQPLVVVDYAHTPDALAQVLKALRSHCLGQLWCVFGCGGDRDRGKRPLMTEVVRGLSDKVILTQDNPRSESPEQIFKDMISRLDSAAKKQVVIEYDRKSAISQAILAAKNDDLIVIAGKGHETYQLIGTEKRPFSDQEEVIQALNRRALCVN